jgi:hypothetical protein
MDRAREAIKVNLIRFPRHGLSLFLIRNSYIAP